MHHHPVSTGVPSAASLTGLERECLRQAVHDLRNRLNTVSVLLHVAIAAAEADAGGPVEKVTQAVRELRTVGGLLDQLVATSDSVAVEIVPIDLRSAVADVARSSDGAARGVSVHASASEVAPTLVLSCPIRLPRVLTLILERCIASLPDGGVIRFTIDPGPERVRLAVTASGPRVIAPVHGRTFALGDGNLPGGEWFPVKALIRGLRGDVRVAPESAGTLGVQIELPSGEAPGMDQPAFRKP